MIDTLIALLFAHVIADFVFQSNDMVKQKREVLPFLLHGAIVFLTLIVATGSLAWQLAALALAHMAIDLAKLILAPKDGLWAFLTDQGAHMLTLVGCAVFMPGLWDGGLWATTLPAPIPNWALHVMALGAGGLMATRAGGFAVGKLMQPYAGAKEDGLADGGRLIGLLERGLIFLMLVAGMPAGIGFLIAAKSVLRFDAASDGKKAEYVIIGTLASFGWAIAITMAILTLRTGLPPLEIGPLTP
ncbi:MAG: DUF3307 domain-containing protein [Maritimibacter sp.]